MRLRTSDWWEGINVEFKQSRNKLNKDVFESVCAFLNRNGGHLFLGVEDKGRGHFINKILNPLIKGGLLKLTIPDKPTSPNQKYYSERL